MKRLAVVCFAIFLIGCGESKDGSIHYAVSFPNAQHNEVEITVTVEEIKPLPVQFLMSRASPGRYALHEFAKNVYNVRAKGGEGDSLDIRRPDLHNWIVSGHNGTVKFSYTLYADRADGTYSGVNQKHAHLNMPATFVWVKGMEDRPITVEFQPPDNKNWGVATQLKETDEPYRFEAPDLAYFLDSPTELSDFTLREWPVESNDTAYTIRLAVHHRGTEQQVDRYAEMAQKVVDEQVAIYGETPDFDYKTYTFISDYLPYVYGDGMEHRNSTILTSTRTLEDDARRNLYTLSHEFFHAWNVERIRPTSLQPFNFMDANMSDVLWFGEGFTSYYDDLTIRRAGITDNGKYAEDWNSTLNGVLNSPGNNYYSPVEMSMQAPFVDAATSVDPQNKINTFISYYSWGAVIGLGLDLTLRTQFSDLSLDDYMRAVWKKYGKPETPYTITDLENTLAQITDSTQFARRFFNRHIRGKQMVDLKPLLEEAGFLLRKANPGRAVIDWGENKISFESGTATVAENTLVGSPLYRAGIDRDDQIRSIDGQPVSNARQLNRIVRSHVPGETLPVVYESLGEKQESTLTLVEDPRLELVPFEQAGREVTDEIRAFRESWLGSKVQ